MSVNFRLSSRLNEFGEAAVIVSFVCDGQNFNSSSGISVDPSAWESGAYKYSTYRNSQGISGDDIYSMLIALEQWVQTFESKLGSSDSLVLKYIDRFIGEQGALCQWANGTADTFRVFRGYIEDFNPQAEFDFFDRAGIDRWLIFLRSKGLEESTVKKNYQLLRWFLLWAQRGGYIRESAIQTYRPKFKLVAKPVIYLTGSELARLYQLVIPEDGSVPNHKTLSVVRDGFCLCAFTSLRYSDLARLRKTDIAGDVMWVTTQKTHDRLPIDLNPPAKKILEKYAGGAGERAMPVISNQKMNIYIKVLCRMCGIDTPVTKVCYRGGKREEKTLPKWALMGTHAARRTFICFALESGIAPQVVMKWTGHSDYKSMRPYIEISERAKTQAMKQFSKSWENAVQEPPVQVQL